MSVRYVLLKKRYYAFERKWKINHLHLKWEFGIEIKYKNNKKVKLYICKLERVKKVLINKLIIMVYYELYFFFNKVLMNKVLE